MSIHPLYDRRMPSPEEIQDAVRRAHAERSLILRDFLVGLLARRGVKPTKPLRRPGLDAVTCG
jgi:hypothetical protein